MNIRLFRLLGLLGFSSALSATVLPQLPELDADLWEYESFIAQDRERRIWVNDEIDTILASGKRLMDWMVFINAKRPTGNQLSLSSPETQPAFPIEAPRVSNKSIVVSEFEALRKLLPQWMSDVVLGKGPFPDLAAPDSEFIRWGIEIDKVYTRASRWRLQEDFLVSYAARMKTDVRGFYYLNKEPNLEAQLTRFTFLAPEKQNLLKTWLVGTCFNSQPSASICRTELENEIESTATALAFYKRHQPKALEYWQSFFSIQAPRSDLDWTEASAAWVPFLEPEEGSPVRDFLKQNIEDEWKWETWSLKLDFRPEGSLSPYLVLKPGATANVNAVGGNRITMDSNRPLNDYSQRWTIRHEFGHVLGFPDCYVEFYDLSTKTMVSYQLDITDLMCSRRGKLKENHYLEMKRTYFKG